MDLTIVIVNWNGGQLLMHCLESIRAHGSGAAVIVIDNDSKDGSREAATATFPEFRIVNSGSNLGFGRGNNLARTMVTTSHVLFLNPDTELMPDTLNTTMDCLRQHPDVGAVGCKMLDGDREVQELGIQWAPSPLTVLVELLFVTQRTWPYLRRLLPTVDPLRSGYVRKLYGGFLLLRRDVLDAAGWFDERYFMYAEDADLSRTLPALGWKLYYCAEAVIMHVGGGVTVGAPSTFSALMMQESVNKLIGKYQGRRAATLHRLVVLVGTILRLGGVVVARVIASVRGSEPAMRRLRATFVNQQQIILWSVGLRQAAIPVSRSHSAAAADQV